MANSDDDFIAAAPPTWKISQLTPKKRVRGKDAFETMQEMAGKRRKERESQTSSVKENTPYSLSVASQGSLQGKEIASHAIGAGSVDKREPLKELLTERCPVCSRTFSTRLLEAHVNACLDSRSPASIVLKAQESDPKDTFFTPRKTYLQQELHVEKPRAQTPGISSTNREALDDALLALLDRLNMRETLLPKLLHCGRNSLSSLRLVTNEDLVQMGVDGLGVRKRLLVELSAIFLERSSLGITDSTAIAIKTPGSKMEGGGKLFPIFERRVSVAKPAVQASGAPNRRKRAAESAAFTTRKDHSICKRVAGTTFTVDSFRCKPGTCRQFFLSHFHADHYGGLRKSFSGAVILCTEETARLVELRIGVPRRLMQILRYKEEVSVPDLGVGAMTGELSGALVTAIDANHCPGAAMFLFKVKSTGKTVLHCGDCRYDAGTIGTDPIMTSLFSTGLEVLHLDTTYCDAKHVFPRQKQVIDAVLQLVRRESFNKKTLFIFGSYQIGKEKLYLRIAEELGLGVFVDARRMRTLQCLDLPETVRKLITTDPNQARIHVGSMSIASLRGARMRLRQHRHRYSNVVAFRPSGWTYNSSNGGNGITRQQKGDCVVYGVAYSEHSSYSELRDFVQHLRPKRILPTVGVRSYEDVRRMHRLLDHQDVP